MLRSAIAVIVGYAAWTAIWLGGNALLFGDVSEVVQAGERYTSAGALAGVIALSVGCSLLAGIVTAAIAKERTRGALLVEGALLLLTGIGVQISAWSLMPAWYHLTFLALLVPMVLVGGRLVGTRVS